MILFRITEKKVVDNDDYDYDSDSDSDSDYVDDDDDDGNDDNDDNRIKSYALIFFFVSHIWLLLCLCFNSI